MSLQRLLDEATRFGPEFDEGLSSHLPMALVALHRLGADDGRLAAFSARYSKRLEPAPPVEAWPSGDAWPGRLGQPQAWPAYQDLFGQWLAHEGIGDLLNQVLPVLLPGCSAAAFHGLIRTAYAVQAVHAPSLVDALAYWACRFQPLGAMPEAADTSDPVALLRLLPAGRSPARLISDRLRDAARDAGLQRTIGRLKIEEGTGEALSRAAAFAYAGSGSFTALHLVTSAHALRTLIPFVDEPATAWRWYWQAFACGVVAARLEPLPPVPVLPWDRIVEAALASDDDHLIKLVDSCREEERCHGGDDWQRAASRAVHQAGARAAGEE